jgi:hypothetical protein
MQWKLNIIKAANSLKKTLHMQHSHKKVIIHHFMTCSVIFRQYTTVTSKNKQKSNKILHPLPKKLRVSRVKSGSSYILLSCSGLIWYVQIDTLPQLPNLRYTKLLQDNWSEKHFDIPNRPNLQNYNKCNRLITITWLRPKNSIGY